MITTRGSQSFRVKNPHSVRVGAMVAPRRLVAALAELRAIMGEDYDRSVEDRSGRFVGGR